MRPKILAVFTVASLALVGCSSAEAIVQDSTRSEVEPAPLEVAVERNSPTESPDPFEEMGENSEDEFFAIVGSDDFSWSGDLPSETEFLAAGYLACQQAEDGVADDDIEVIQGAYPVVTDEMTEDWESWEIAEYVREERKSPVAQDNIRLVSAALSSLCKQHLYD